MTSAFENLPFKPADILLPRDCDLSKWAVVACDQYTSQPEYWERVARNVGTAPSALHLILPESSLEGPGVEQDITEINLTMAQYLRGNRFREYPESLFYVERTLSGGKVRRGLMGMVDLEEYDYEAGAETRIRATEGTVMTRIPPRVRVRKNAPIELPHVLLLADDPGKTVIEPLAGQTGEMEPVYDFELMERGGHIKGWRLNRAQMERVGEALEALAEPDAFARRYRAQGKPVLLFAVGDGNHSLATAKACYERQKELARDGNGEMPARYALVELTNLHDDSLEFEPIHRVVFQTDPEQLLAGLLEAYPGAHLGGGEGHRIEFVHSGGGGVVTVPEPDAQLPVGTLQNFLDQWLSARGGRVDYIHGDEVTREFGRREGNIAFLLPAMGKEQLFPTVIFDGALPRKTFSMGHADDKRFYLEARRIR